MPARTIDNLGYEASERYAQNQKFLDGNELLTKDAHMIFSRTSIEVMEPSFHAELDQSSFHLTQKSSAWADFFPPMGYFEQKRFFTHELLPCLSNKEKTEELKQKISQTKEKDQESNQNASGNPKEDWEIVKEEEAEEKEREALTNLLNCILHLDNCMIYVHGKRAQYHKG